MPAYSLVTDREASQHAIYAAKRTFARNARAFPQHSVGWQGGGGRFDVYWHSALGVWGVFEPGPPVSKTRPRFWICFGIGDPGDRGMLTITVETNPPHEGVDRRVGGAFLRDADGRVYLAHTGKVGGGRKGIGQRTFLAFYEGGQRTFIPERGAELIILAPVDSSSLAQAISDFVKQVARFKETATRRSPVSSQQGGHTT